jgi:hypothetical protein
VLGGEAVDLAQLLRQQVGAVQALVEFLDPRELELLALGEVLGVLPERKPGSFEVLGELGLSGLACFVPDLAADLIERVSSRPGLPLASVPSRRSKPVPWGLHPGACHSEVSSEERH